MTQGPATARLLTAPARGGIAVIALTGCGAEDVLRRIFRPRKAWPQRCELSLGEIVSVEYGQVLDEAVATCGRDAATGQTTIELCIHGGPQVARAVLGELQRQGAEIAPATEIDPILARPHPRWNNPAIAQEMAAALRDAITPLAAAAVTWQWSAGLSQLASTNPSAAALRACAERWPGMRRLLEPAEVVVAGPPNAGKSSLVNALAGRDVSIVSDIPGTTRDWVRTLIDLDGVPIWLTDTAGLWEETSSRGGQDPPRGPNVLPCGPDTPPPHEVDREALERAWQRIASADLVLCLTAGEPTPSDQPLLARVLGGPGDRPGAMLPRRLGKHDVPPQGECTRSSDSPPYPRPSCFPEKQGSMAPGRKILHISSKADCIPPAAAAQLAVSAKTFLGLPKLRRAVVERLGLANFDPQIPAAFTPRQAALLTTAANAMENNDRPAAQAALRELLEN